MVERGCEAAYFGETFAESRAKFLLAVAQAGGVATSYVHPDEVGPDGGTLSIDVGVFGAAGARRAFMILSGTHGGEGYAGSAAQIAFIRSGALDTLAHDVRVVLVHGLNPYGFAHWTRTTEHNVDLNRNFMDFSQPLPRNPGYLEVHPFLCPDEWSEEALAAAQRGMDKWIAEHGHQAWIQTIMKGQYEQPSGLNYGGDTREWSNLTLETIVGTSLAGVEKLAFIDWHTGLGDWGEPFFLCFSEKDSSAWARACDWWGRARIETTIGFAGARRPTYNGLVLKGVEAWTAPAEMVGAVVEFGTLPLQQSLDQLRIDRWLKFGNTPDDPQRLADMRRGTRDGFTPPDREWRRRIIGHAGEIQLQGLEGLTAW